MKRMYHLTRVPRSSPPHLKYAPWFSPDQNIMAIDGGERNCGVHELICIRKVSPEALGFLSGIGVFIFLVIVLFLYLNNKLSLESANQLPSLDQYRKSAEPAGVQIFNKTVEFKVCL